MSTFGKLLSVSTFGESHGKAVGCILDGIPAELPLSVDDLQYQLNRRSPGQSSITTQRKEKDIVEILSGTEQGVTLGTPIAMLVRNHDIKPSDYISTRDIPRPGHADFTYQMKYGLRASSGGGRSSARETIARVAAGTVAEAWLKHVYDTTCCCWVSSIGPHTIPADVASSLEGDPPTRDAVDRLGSFTFSSEGNLVDYEGNHYDPLFGSLLSIPPKVCVDPFAECVVTCCPHTPTAAKMLAEIIKLREEGDSTGGITTCVLSSVPVGIGEPCFDKLEAELAKAMLSLPATKGFEIGDGFKGTCLRGSQHNDCFIPSSLHSSLLSTSTNHAGGTLGGISTGQNLVFRVAFKPVSSISLLQETCTFNGEIRQLGITGRHDPCVLPRAPPLVEAMAALVVADAALRQRARSGNIPLKTIGPSLRENND
ncbi:putative chorismate synthase [Cardiosporidium cionae]|uniref:chorismate synthase n=1 Tax=Cardiosporidium cionae TaxID=476202 RepID=A0ABQ7JD25_9APIC|nr:putative chorismate synthase [Cardiosporidium cionae]|eukprot:KAF8821922.1 putative chorismate synthase [Cardiosporidium cionae]